MLEPKPADRDDQDVVVIAPAIVALSVLARDTPPPFLNARPSLKASLNPAPDFFADWTAPPIDARFRPAADDAHQVGAEIHAQSHARIHVQADGQEMDDEAATKAADQHPWLGHLMRRSATAGLVMLLGIVATLAWRTHGHDAEQIVARWAPEVALAWLPLKVTEPSSPSAVQAAEAPVAQSQPDAPAPSRQPGSQQPGSSAQASPGTAAPAASDGALQAMARDLARAQQTIEELKGNQDLLAREIAKLVEQQARFRSAALSPRPASALPRKPAPALPSPQATAPPPPASPSQALAQAPVQPRPPSVPRPPAPLP